MRTHLRWHYPDGRVVNQPLARFALTNGVNIRDARLLLEQWQVAGDIVLRADGGFDVVRYHPPAGRPRATLAAPVDPPSTVDGVLTLRPGPAR